LLLINIRSPSSWGKFVSFLKKFVNSKRIFRSTHKFVTKCNEQQFRLFTSLHIRYKLISRWKISNYYGQVIDHCMGMVLSSLFSAQWAMVHCQVEQTLYSRRPQQRTGVSIYLSIYLSSLFSLALHLLAISNLKPCNRLNVDHLYDPPMA
jgi:hypothetical protein